MDLTTVGLCYWVNKLKDDFLKRAYFTQYSHLNWTVPINATWKRVLCPEDLRMILFHVSPELPLQQLIILVTQAKCSREEMTSDKDSKMSCRISLVVQWIRIPLPMQGTWVQALVREDPTCSGTTKPVRHNYWACALEPTIHNCWSSRI